MENELGLTGLHHNVGNTELQYGQDIRTQNAVSGVANTDDTAAVPFPSNGKGVHVGAAHAATMVAMTAGLSPRSHTGSTLGGTRHFLRGMTEVADNSERSSPGLAMGIGMGLASGVAATINAAIFQRPHPVHPTGPIIKVQPNRVTVAAAAAAVRPPPLEELGIHQVESSDGTHGKK